MDSVSRGELPDALHLSFHSAGFDVFIQARQANYKSNADLTTGLTPLLQIAQKSNRPPGSRDNYHGTDPNGITGYRIML
jgi:hypothetical protein